MMRRSRRSRSNCKNLPSRQGNVDQAKVARAKAAIKAAKSKSPQNKQYYRSKRWLKAAIDLETPKSLLVNVRLKSLINLDTYSFLSPWEKERLIHLLPSCDQLLDERRIPIPSAEALNNEFFAKACVEWCERLGEGEFQKDRQQGDTSFKVKQFGIINGVKSRLMDGFLANSMNAVAPIRHSRHHAKRSRFSRFAFNDAGSLASEVSSESSLSLQNERIIPFSPCKTTKVHCVCKETVFLNECPALRDHDYCVPLRNRFGNKCCCECLRKSTENKCSAYSMQNNGLCVPSLDGASSNSLLNTKPEMAKRKGRVSRMLKDYVVDSKNLFSRITGDGSEVMTRLGHCVGNTTIHTNADSFSRKENGWNLKASRKLCTKANGEYSLKNDFKDCSTDWLDRNCSAASTDTSLVTYNSSKCVNSDSVPALSHVGTNSQLSISSCASSSILNQTSNSQSSNSSSNSYLSRSASCLAELEFKDKKLKFISADDSQLLNASHLEKPNIYCETDAISSFCKKKRRFVKFIGIQKIVFDNGERKFAQKHFDLNYVDDTCPSHQNGKHFPEFVIEEVRKYVHSGLNTTFTGVYSSLNVRNQMEESNHAVSCMKSCQNFSKENKTGDLDSQEKDTWTTTEEKANFGSGVTAEKNGTEDTGGGSVDCIWEALAPQNCDLNC